MTDSAILVFAKTPLKGQVKTRLIPLLGEQGATDLYRKLLYRSVAMLRSNDKTVKIEFWCYPDALCPDFQYVQSTLDCSLYKQVGKDLGERMSYAAKNALKRYQQVILIGVDCPGLTMNLVNLAISHLKNKYDAVLGPAEDGGYVLLGLKRVVDCVFEAVPWGTEMVADVTRKCFEKNGWNWLELPVLWDVDKPEDGVRFLEDIVGTEIEGNW